MANQMGNQGDQNVISSVSPASGRWVSGSGRTASSQASSAMGFSPASGWSLPGRTAADSFKTDKFAKKSLTVDANL